MYARFRRALKAGNPLLVRAAAAELPQVSLADALAICLVFARSEPAVYDRAAVRWLGRLLIETRAFSLSDTELLARTLREAPAADRLAAMQRELARLLTARGQASLLDGLA